MECWPAGDRSLRSRRRSGVPARRTLSALDARLAPQMKLTRKDWVRLLLLWLGGIDLRLTVLAVPPVSPQIHHDPHLDDPGGDGLRLAGVAAVPPPGDSRRAWIAAHRQTWHPARARDGPRVGGAVR